MYGASEWMPDFIYGHVSLCLRFQHWFIYSIVSWWWYSSRVLPCVFMSKREREAKKNLANHISMLSNSKFIYHAHVVSLFIISVCVQNQKYIYQRIKETILAMYVVYSHFYSSQLSLFHFVYECASIFRIVVLLWIVCKLKLFIANSGCACVWLKTHTLTHTKAQAAMQRKLSN